MTARKAESKDRKLLGLVFPFALVALVSVGAAIASLYFEDDAGVYNLSTHVSRFLEDQQVVGERFYSKSAVVSEPLVFEENHTPLLPLTQMDKIGFVCATLGLMIAAEIGRAHV